MEQQKNEVLPGTLNLMVLKTLSTLGPLHGCAGRRHRVAIWRICRFCGVFGEAALKAHTSPVTATSKVLLSRYLSNVGGRYHSDQIVCF